jgi:hypothetical protein
MISIIAAILALALLITALAWLSICWSSPSLPYDSKKDVISIDEDPAR